MIMLLTKVFRKTFSGNRAINVYITINVYIKRRLSYTYSVELGRNIYGVTNTGSPGPPLIISHGLMGNKSNWHSICKVLSRSGRKIISLDARNHGDSPHCEDMEYHHMSEDILRLMDEEDIDTACLLGHSMGGKTSMVAALTEPDRISGLIVVDVSPTPSPGAKSFPSYLQCMLKIKSRFSEMHNIPLPKARQIARDTLIEVEQNTAIREFLVSNLIEKHGKIQWRVNIDSIINCFPSISGFPEFNSQYGGPTLFIGGEKSPYITDKEEPLIHSLFPAAEIQHIPNAGHWVHSDNPSAFIRLVQEFLERTQTYS